MVARVGHIRSGSIQPGKHRWRMTGGYLIPGGSYGIHVCMVCGVRVDTRAPFPSWNYSEKWNGKVVKARAPRPPCLTRADDGVQ